MHSLLYQAASRTYARSRCFVHKKNQRRGTFVLRRSPCIGRARARDRRWSSIGAEAVAMSRLRLGVSRDLLRS